jgi:hypothetical protein
MPLSFVETMRGWMRGDGMPDFPVSFELAAINVRRGHFEVRGLVAAPPFAAETPARGTLKMGLGSIAYHLEFARDGKRYCLDATKHPTVLAPLRSMTRMNATIADEAGRVVASGEMRFEARDLAAFVASWLPTSKEARHRLDTRRRSIERRALNGSLAIEVRGRGVR